MRGIKKVLSVILSTLIGVSAIPLTAFAAQPEEFVPYLGTARKEQYVLSSSSDTNALQLNSTNVTLNGNLYTGANLNAYSAKVDIRGKCDIGGELREHRLLIKRHGMQHG